MKFIETRRARQGLNLTSLIDVLFLLLIFVLLSAKFEEEGGVAVNLPQGSSKELPDIQTVEIAVTADGTIHLGTEIVPEDRLAEVLRAEADKAKESVIVIKGDEASHLGKTAIILDLAKQSGFTRIAIKLKN